MSDPVWTVREAKTPDELEVLLNNLADDGYDLHSISDRLTHWIVIAWQMEEE